MGRAALQYSYAMVAFAALACGSSDGGSGNGNTAGAGGAGHAGAGSTAKGGADGHGGAVSSDSGAKGDSGDSGDSGDTGQTGDSGAAGETSSQAGSGATSGAAGNPGGGSSSTAGAGGGSAGDSGAPPVPANDTCAKATALQLGSKQSIDIAATTLGAQHDVDPPCRADTGPDVFYEFEVSKRVFVYADTFGANWNTVLYLLSNDCKPLTTSTTSGDALCNDSACGTSQSQIVALLEAGRYRLGLSGRSGAAGAATIHFQFALAGSGSAAPLPKGNTMQAGSTVGASGNMQGISADCLAAGPENAYWWASCPSDAGGALTASTCGGAAWETVLALELPASKPYSCSSDSCSLQASLSSTIPAGAGLRVLAVDGQGGTDKGAYTMMVSRP